MSARRHELPRLPPLVPGQREHGRRRRGGGDAGLGRRAALGVLERDIQPLLDLDTAFEQARSDLGRPTLGSADLRDRGGEENSVPHPLGEIEAIRPSASASRTSPSISWTQHR